MPNDVTKPNSDRSLMNSLLDAILRADHRRVTALLADKPALATATVLEARLFDKHIAHWLYAGDTALHLAAAGYRVEIIAALLDAGADPNAHANHRRSAPLHYAADGVVGDSTWQPERQVVAIHALVAAGAQINSPDKNGASALHRATRTRCASAVRALLALGADPAARNGNGSTPFHLAVQNTGRGGTGAVTARDQQREIIEAFCAAGVSDTLTDGNGKSVRDCARQAWVRVLLDT
jgi:hypothetical protein